MLILCLVKLQNSRTELGLIPAHLDYLKDVDKGVSLHQQPFSLYVGFQQFFLADTILGCCQGCRMVPTPVKRGGKLIS